MRYRYMRFPNGLAKAVTLSYDDGCKYDIRFSKVISDYGMKCTFNLNSEDIRKDLTKEDIYECFLSKGHEIAVHGSNHRANGIVRAINGIKDVLDCRLELEKRFNIIIRGMAYPDTGITYFTNTASYESIKEYLKNLDIVYARTLGGDNDLFYIPTDWYAWMPTAHHNNPKVLEYIDKFINMDLSIKQHFARRTPRLFYLWGHSFEFERDDNWAHLNNICEKLANRDDIWYATNMQIYEYTKAYESLVYSADETLVYNPSLLDVWFDIDGVIYKIASGETLKIKDIT